MTKFYLSYSLDLIVDLARQQIDWGRGHQSEKSSGENWIGEQVSNLEIFLGTR